MENVLISVEMLAETVTAILFNLLDVGIALLFLDVFGKRRLHGVQYWAVAGSYWLAALVWCKIYKSRIGFSFMVKMLVLMGLLYITCCILYTGLSRLYLAFLVVIQYLAGYLYSASVSMAASALCGVTVQQFADWSYAPYYLLSAMVYYSSALGFVLGFRRLFHRWGRQNLPPRYFVLYFVFPAASLLSLAALLRLSNDQPVSLLFIVGCCFALLLANFAVFYLLHQMEQAAQEHERLVTLNQQLKMQSVHMETATALYEAQRKATHDFQSQLEVLGQLLAQHKYADAQTYLRAVAARQTERLVLVNCRHGILDALFNTKAAAALRKGIEIRFEVSDLSGLPFDPADLTVLLANLLDNAIEACEKCAGLRAVEVQAVLEESFYFSVRNTSRPVAIVEDTISTTKPDPKLHGFGLANVKAILDKYHGFYAMEYADGWFQFAGEMPVSQDPEKTTGPACGPNTES